MVQVLPGIAQQPLLVEQIAPYVQQMVGGLQDYYKNQQQQKQAAKDQTLLSQLAPILSGDKSPLDVLPLWSQLSEQTRKMYEPFLQTNLRRHEAENKENLKRKTIESTENLKRETQELEKEEGSNAIIDILDEMEPLIEYTGSTKIPFTSSFSAGKYGVNRKGLEKRNEFDTLAASAASFFRDLETKGQLPQGLYEKVILPRLPSSEISERENKGRMKAIRSLAKKYGGKSLREASKATKAEKTTVNVYDASGQLVGTIDSKESDKLPAGYSVR